MVRLSTTLVFFFSLLGVCCFAADIFTYSIWEYVATIPYVCNNPGGPIESKTGPSPVCVGYSGYNKFNINMSKVAIYRCVSGQLALYDCLRPIAITSDGSCNPQVNFSACTRLMVNPYLCGTIQTGDTLVPMIKVKAESCSGGPTTTTPPVSSYSNNTDASTTQLGFITIMTIILVLSYIILT